MEIRCRNGVPAGGLTQSWNTQKLTGVEANTPEATKGGPGGQRNT